MNYDFPVELRDVFYADAEGRRPWAIKDKKAIVNVDNEEILSVVSDRYALTEHKEIVNVFNEIEGITQDQIKLSGNGAVMFAKYKIDGLQPVEVKKGDFVDFSIRVFNSYNRMTTRGFELVGNRLICTNGMTVPKTIAGFSFRHRGKSGDMRIKEIINDYPNRIQDTVNVWKSWDTLQPTTSKITSFYKKLNLSENIENELIEKSLEKVSLWEMYNVLTSYTTHQMISRGKNAIANARKKAIEYSDKFYKFNWN